MPVTYHIDRSLGAAFTTATGRLTAEEVVDLKQRLAADPDFCPGFVELSDVRGVTELDFDPSDLFSLAMADAGGHGPSGDGYRLALVVASEEVFEMARGYQVVSVASGPDVAVFRDPASARAWLGLPAE